MHDPSAVFERVADGGVASPEAIDTVQKVFPSLLVEAQRCAIEKLSRSREPIPYQRRLAMGSLLGIPLDPSQMPDHAAFLQAKYAASPAAAQSGAPIGTPTIRAPVNFGDRSTPGLDKRIG